MQVIPASKGRRRPLRSVNLRRFISDHHQFLPQSMDNKHVLIPTSLDAMIQAKPAPIIDWWADGTSFMEIVRLLPIPDGNDSRSSYMPRIKGYKNMRQRYFQSVWDFSLHVIDDHQLCVAIENQDFGVEELQVIGHVGLALGSRRTKRLCIEHRELMEVPLGEHVKTTAIVRIEKMRGIIRFDQENLQGNLSDEERMNFIEACILYNENQIWDNDRYIYIRAYRKCTPFIGGFMFEDLVRAVGLEYAQRVMALCPISTYGAVIGHAEITPNHAPPLFIM